MLRGLALSAPDRRCGRLCANREPASVLETRNPSYGRAIYSGARSGDRLGVSEAGVVALLDTEIAPRFPEGSTVLSASGQWREPARGSMVREPSKTVTIVLLTRRRADEVRKKARCHHRRLQDALPAAGGRAHPAPGLPGSDKLETFPYLWYLPGFLAKVHALPALGYPSPACDPFVLNVPRDRDTLPMDRLKLIALDKDDRRSGVSPTLQDAQW